MAYRSEIEPGEAGRQIEDAYQSGGQNGAGTGQSGIADPAFGCNGDEGVARRALYRRGEAWIKSGATVVSSLSDSQFSSKIQPLRHNNV